MRTLTDWYKFNPWPEEAVVRCDRCRSAATFRVSFSLTQFSDRSWQEWKGRLWPSARVTSWDRKESWSPGEPDPSWRGWIVIEHDPGIHRWVQPSEGHRQSDTGIVFCAQCSARREHRLRWPEDAWYRFELRQGLLWAWSRAHVDALIDYIASTDRDAGAHHPFGGFLRHVPSEFLAVTDRDEIVKRLRREVERLDHG